MKVDRRGWWKCGGSNSGTPGLSVSPPGVRRGRIGGQETQEGDKEKENETQFVRIFKPARCFDECREQKAVLCQKYVRMPGSVAKKSFVF